MDLPINPANYVISRAFIVPNFVTVFGGPIPPPLHELR